MDPKYRATIEFRAPSDWAAWQIAHNLASDKALVQLMDVEKEDSYFMSVSEPKDDKTDPIPFPSGG